MLGVSEKRSDLDSVTHLDSVLGSVSGGEPADSKSSVELQCAIHERCSDMTTPGKSALSLIGEKLRDADILCHHAKKHCVNDVSASFVFGTAARQGAGKKQLAWKL